MEVWEQKKNWFPDEWLFQYSYKCILKTRQVLERSETGDKVPAMLLFTVKKMFSQISHTRFRAYTLVFFSKQKKNINFVEFKLSVIISWPFLFVRNKLVGKMAAFTGSPHHLTSSSSEGNSVDISKAIGRKLLARSFLQEKYRKQAVCHKRQRSDS